MRRSHRMWPATTIFALGLLFTGCADLPQRRLTRVDPPPAKPSTPLQLPAPPTPAVQPAELKTTPQADPGKPPVTQVRAVGESAANPLRALHDHAAKRYQTMDTYIMRLKRREVVGGKARPEELILVKFRQEPWSVYFKWIGPEAKGREVVHVKGQYDNRIHSLVAAGDVLLMPAGQRFSVAVDSAMVRSKSRYPITEAGLGTSIHRFGLLVATLEKGDKRQGTAKYLGLVKRTEFETPVEGVEQTVPPESDPLLPGGGRRWWFFDPTSAMPVLVITHDETGREVEYYCYDRILAPARLDDDDFNPDKLWKKK